MYTAHSIATMGYIGVCASRGIEGFFPSVGMATSHGGTINYVRSIAG